MKSLTRWRLIAIRWRGFFVPDGALGDRKRGALIEPYLKRCGSNFKLASQAFIYAPGRLTVGDNVYVGFNSYLGNGEIDLGDEVLIGGFVSITASNHLSKNGSFRFGGISEDRIQVGSGTWIGSNSSITAGVVIGKNCLIASGAVVTKDVPDNTIVGGVPAKNIGMVENV